MKTTKITQGDQVVNAIKKLGGIATPLELYSAVNTSKWGARSPDATIRRIVQTDKRIYKIRRGLYCLYEQRKSFKEKYNERSSVPKKQIYNHSYYQGLLLKIGKRRGYKTYVPKSDRGRQFLARPPHSGKTLDKLASFNKDIKFGYEKIMKDARTVDVIYFNERKMPCEFYEVEMTHNIDRSLNKFHELQDFNANFYIVGPKRLERNFNNKISKSMYKGIKKRVKFLPIETIVARIQKEAKDAEEMLPAK